MATNASPVPAKAARASETFSVTAYQELRRDVLNGTLKPGQKLQLHALKGKYSLGNSPLREALNRLTSNGLVVHEENRGFRVSEVSADELMQITKTRCWLEEVALRQSISNADDKYEERIVLALHRLEKLARSHQRSGGSAYSTPELEARHSEFHAALISRCQSKYLSEYCSELQDLSLRYRSLAEVVKYREGHEGSEHRGLVDAIFDRDADAVVEKMTRHYMKTADILISSGVIV